MAGCAPSSGTRWRPCLRPALDVVAARAADANWTGASSNWTDPANWNPNVPDGTATFTSTGATSIDNSNGIVTIGSLLLTNTAQAYSFTVFNPFIINAAGNINNSGDMQTFEVTSGNNLVFQNSSTASGGTGAVTITNDAAGTVNFIQNSTAGTVSLTNNSFVTFEDSSSAGSASITNNLHGQIDFFTSATAGTATISNAAGASLNFHTTAASSTITNNGTVTFDGSATAGNATITTNNGTTTNFADNATGGGARFITNADGTVDISRLTSGGMTSGSIEGPGNYVLGANTLTTGSLNTSTQVDGVISGTGGGLTKVGTGTPTLTAARPISPPRWPMAGMTSPPTAPSRWSAPTSSRAGSRPTPSRPASRVAIASRRR